MTRKATVEKMKKMRPFELDGISRGLTVLQGIGPRNGALLEKLIGGPKIADLLWHMPIDFVDRRFTPAIQNAPNGRIATLEVIPVKHNPPPRRSLPYRVTCKDDTGTMNLIFFRAQKDWLEKQLPLNEPVLISGKIDFYQGRPQMAHPDYIVPVSERYKIERLEPIYPLTQGLTNKTVSKAIDAALDLLPDLPEWLDPTFLQKIDFPNWKNAVTDIHVIDGEQALDPQFPARRRLAYDELLSNQLALALVRYRQKRQMGRSYKPTGELRQKMLAALPFELTGAQQKSLADIDADMTSELRMLRLMQGDVGSGKTVVAALAMLTAVENGAQAALMAPTEILARQHGESLRPWLDKAGIRYIVLTGRDKGKAKETLLQQIKNGAAQIVIGTHALFQDSVEFNDLGLAIVDEQHRFGVDQRLQLSNKGKDGKGTDVLVMTATPIPRTLTLTAYGDMDVSLLDEKPPGRKPIDTRLISTEHTDDMIDGIERQIQKGERVYWVCPLVEESEFMDVAAAQERFEILEARFGDRVGLVHGRMKAQEKDDIMQKFVDGDIDILVATTVIEVGVNVPEATIIVIEHAERFGLAQLHQLRGRVGRGSDKSYCFLLYKGPLSETAKERLGIMRDSEDGFKIAEKDLELRGSGEILGTKQSGLPTFRLARLPDHNDLLQTARDDARLIIDKDPTLSETERGQALRVLLYLFDRDQAIQYIRSG